MTRTRAPGPTQRPRLEPARHGDASHEHGPAAAALRSQQTIGNRATARAFAGRRTGPTPRMLGAHDDRFEREAEAVADGLEGRKVGLMSDARPRIQRAASAPGGLGPVAPQVDAAIDGARGSGRALPGALARSIGERIGGEFSDVRVHTDARADALNRRLNARAFTTGRDIFFRRGEYDPGSAAGRRILAHELTHVAQQRGAGPRAPIQRFVFQIGQDDAYTEVMFKQLVDGDASGEQTLKITALWDRNDEGQLIDPNPYNPQVDKIKWGLPPKRVKETVQKLGAVGDAEKLRIVAHGSIKGQVGGYKATELGDMLIRIGLPKTHTGGIDVHACLPGYAWTDENQQVQQPVIVALQDYLGSKGYGDKVRGYEHCIFPSLDAEVPSSGYSLMQKVALEAKAAHRVQEASTFELTDEKIGIMRSTMGVEAANRVIASFTKDGKTVDNPIMFFFELRNWMEDNGLKQKAKLRRASSVRLADT